MNNVLEYASRCYGFDMNNIIHIDSGSNKVYKFQKYGFNYYLRISERPFSYVFAEIDWLMYLKDSIRVPVPIISSNFKQIETFQKDEETYVLCVFSELKGAFWDKNDAAKWNDTVFYNWGKTMGKMHCITKEYSPAKNVKRRPLLEDELYSPDTIKYIPSASNILKEIIKEILKLPKDIASYGLIHSDMHQQNFLIRHDGISVLDFDDCTYGWFAYDVGIALFHAVWWGIPEAESEKNDFAMKIISNFLKGYLTENHLSNFWLRKILLFMRFRQIGALSWFVNPNNVNEILNIDLFKIKYDVKKNISFIEQGIFFEGCIIVEDNFINTLI